MPPPPRKMREGTLTPGPGNFEGQGASLRGDAAAALAVLREFDLFESLVDLKDGKPGTHAEDDT